ncbi:MAG: zf-HC2 domain-containing protein [Acidobacteria bacterium]|nr:zf-HC2 domain-containing protein [Acidobacteriota bacterium]
MKCENLQFNLSLYIDDVLTNDERALVDRHLAQCPLCRQRLDDFAALRQSLRRVTRSVPPANLLASVKTAMRAELAPAEPKKKSYFSRSFLEFLQMQVMPYTVGTAASLFLGFSLLWILLSNANYDHQFELAKNPPVEIPKTDDTLAEFVGQRGLVSSESPSVNPQGALMAVTQSLINRKVKDDEVVIVADVNSDGIAKIEEIVEPLDDQQTVYEIENAMQKKSSDAPFVPAFLDRRADSVRVVLKIQRVEIQTSQPKVKP